MGKYKSSEYEAAYSGYQENIRQHTGLGQILQIMMSMGYTESQIINHYQAIKDALGLLPSITPDVDSEFTPIFHETLNRLRAVIEARQVSKSKYEDKKRQCENERYDLQRTYKEKLGNIPERELSLLRASSEIARAKTILSARENEIKERERQLNELESKLRNMETPESRDMVRRMDLFLSSVTKSEKTERAIAYGVGSILSGKPAEFNNTSKE